MTPEEKRIMDEKRRIAQEWVRSGSPMAIPLDVLDALRYRHQILLQLETMPMVIPAGATVPDKAAPEPAPAPAEASTECPDV